MPRKPIELPLSPVTPHDPWPELRPATEQGDMRALLQLLAEMAMYVAAEEKRLGRRLM
jgi:hypothetical protein